MKKSLLSLFLVSVFGLQGCSNLVEKPESEWTVDDFYRNAKEAMVDSQWDVAAQYYEKLKAYYPYGEFAEQAYLDLAYSYYKYDEPTSAIRELDEFIRTYPKHRALPYAYYLKALSTDSINKSWLDAYLSDPARRDMASTKEAYQAYETLIKKFPDSEYSVKAKQRLIELRNRIARHHYQVAKYYFDRKGYLAAANRSRELLALYPRSHVTLKTLKLLKKSYEKLGMNQSAKDVEAVIKLNYES